MCKRVPMEVLGNNRSSLPYIFQANLIINHLHQPSFSPVFFKTMVLMHFIIKIQAGGGSFLFVDDGSLLDF